MKTGDLVKLFGVSNKTIQNWVKEFENFLSDGAKKLDGRQSIFDSHDFIIMATIAELSQKEKLPYSVIQEKLVSGYRIEDVSAATVGYEDGRTVPAAAVEQIIDATSVRVELEQVKAERDKLLDMLNQKEKRERELIEKLDNMQNQIAELQRQLGRAEGELNLRRQQEDQAKKRRWFGGE